MQTMTVKNKPISERILERREQFFSDINHKSEAEIKVLAERWHRIINRYNQLIIRASNKILALEIFADFYKNINMGSIDLGDIYDAEQEALKDGVGQEDIDRVKLEINVKRF